MINIINYQNFVADYFKVNPNEITQLFNKAEGSEVLDDAVIAGNWSLDDESVLFGDELDEEERLDKLERLNKKYGNKIKEFHRLALLNDKYDGQVVYLILESNTGQLFMNEYVGD